MSAGYWMQNQQGRLTPQQQQAAASLMASDIDYRRLGPPPSMDPNWGRSQAPSGLPSRDPLRITIANEARLAAEAQAKQHQPAPAAAPQMNWQRADEILRMAEEPESLQITIGNELAAKKSEEMKKSGLGAMDLLGGDDIGELGNLLEQLAEYSNTYDAVETAESQLDKAIGSQFSQAPSFSQQPPAMSAAPSGLRERPSYASVQEMRLQQEQEMMRSQYDQRDAMRSGIPPTSSYQSSSMSSAPFSGGMGGSGQNFGGGSSSWGTSQTSQLTPADQVALYERLSEASPSVQRSFLSQNIQKARESPQLAQSMGIQPQQQAPQISKPPEIQPAAEPELSEQDKIKKVLESMGFNFDLSQKMQLLAEMTRKKEQEVMEKRQQQQQQPKVQAPAPAVPQQPTVAQTRMPPPSTAAQQVQQQFQQPPPQVGFGMQKPPPSMPGTVAYPQIPGTSPTSPATGVVRDAEWERATRQFEEKLKQPSGRKRRGSSSSSSSSGREKSRRTSSEKKARKRAEEERKKKEKAERQRKEKEERERKQREEKEKKQAEEEERKLLKLQLEAEAQQMIEKMKDMREKQSQHDKKMILLRGELERLKRQHGELCRKVQRTKDGHKDPLLTENARLQAAIVKQLNQITAATEEFEKLAGNGAKRVSEIRQKLSELAKFEQPEPKKAEKSKAKKTSKDRDSSTDSKKKDKKKNKKSKSSPAPPAEKKKIYYAFFDAGSHWCNLCKMNCATIFDMFQHFHTDEHKSKLNLSNASWVPESVKDPSKKEAPKNVSIMIEPIKGVEFMVPAATALYCDLCKVFVGDYLCAEEHVRSQEHGINYRVKKHLEVNPLYERNMAMNKAAGSGRGGSEAFQEIATEDIKVTVKNADAVKQPKGQPGFGIMTPAGKSGAQANNKPPDLRSVLNDGKKMQIKITQGPVNGSSAQKKAGGSSGGGSSPGKKAPGRIFQEDKDKKSRWNTSRSRSPPRAYSGRRSASPTRSKRRSVSPGRSRDRHGHHHSRSRRSRSRSRSRDSKRRLISRELPYRTPPPSGSRPTALSNFEERQKALREEEEKRKKERQDMIEEAKKKNAQLLQSQRVADAIKRQLAGKASPEDLTILATYGKQQLLMKKQKMMASAEKAVGGALKAPQTKPTGYWPVVPPPSEFLERFRSATKHIGVVKPAVTTASAKAQTTSAPSNEQSFWGPKLPPDSKAPSGGSKEQKAIAPAKEIDLTGDERKSIGGEDDWHLSLPDTAADQGVTIHSSPEEIPRLGGGQSSNLDDLTELADLADQVVKDMNEKKEGNKQVEDEDFGINFDDLEVVDQL